MAIRKTTTNGSKPKDDTAKAEQQTQPAGAPRATSSRNELIERKKLAGAGRREAPGSAFGSRWTEAERAELQALMDEHGREQAIATFVAVHPHRTAHGAAYQIDRHMKKRAK